MDLLRSWKRCVLWPRRLSSDVSLHHCPPAPPHFLHLSPTCSPFMLLCTVVFPTNPPPCSATTSSTSSPCTAWTGIRLRTCWLPLLWVRVIQCSGCYKPAQCHTHTCPHLYLSSVLGTKCAGTPGWSLRYLQTPVPHPPPFTPGPHQDHVGQTNPLTCLWFSSVWLAV